MAIYFNKEEELEHRIELLEIAMGKVRLAMSKSSNEETAELPLHSVINCKPSEKAALKAAVDAIYFDDNSDYQTALYQVICSLTGLEYPNNEEVKKLFNALNPD